MTTSTTTPRAGNAGAAPLTSVTVRLFAGARAAAGGTAETTLSAGPTVADVMAALGEAHPGLVRVLPACSFLVDGVHATGATRVERACTLDVLPPFSGG